MIRNYLIGTVLLGLVVIEASAQFSMSGEIRPRSEFRNGFKTLTNDDNQPAFFIEQRSRLYMDYKDEKFAVKLSFQDVRMWGEVPQIFKTDAGNTFISEAWGQYYFTPKFSVKVGRQIISYDNQRFIGGLEWAQQGRRHDALLLVYEDEESKTKIHLGGAFNQDDTPAEPVKLQGPAGNLYDVAGNYKTMQYAWIHKDFSTGGLSLVALNDGFQNLADTSVSFRQTFGLTGQNKFGGVTLGGDFYYQMGKMGDNEIDAYLAGLNLTFKTPVTPITLGVELISGKDDDDSTATITSFDPAYGTNHAHNGYMDYFFVGPANGSVGVTDIYVKTKFDLLGGSLNINVHEFLTGSTQMDLADGSDLSSTMGTEVDLVFTKKVADAIVWHLGYSQMFATGTMEALRGGDKSSPQIWAWTMLTFTPKFL